MLGEEGEQVSVGNQSEAVGTQQTLDLRGPLLIHPYWRNRQERGRMATWSKHACRYLRAYYQGRDPAKEGTEGGAVRVFGCWLGSTHQNGGVNSTKVLLHDGEVVKTVLCVLSFGLKESFYSLDCVLTELVTNFKNSWEKEQRKSSYDVGNSNPSAVFPYITRFTYFVTTAPSVLKMEEIHGCE